MEDVYKSNRSMPVIVDTYFNALDNIDILRILETLDYQDKLFFIELIRHNDNESHLFLIENKEMLSLFVRLSTRESLFSIFHFTYVPITIVGNYDLSFPIFCNKESTLKNYLTMARKNDLFFRSIDIIS